MHAKVFCPAESHMWNASALQSIDWRGDGQSLHKTHLLPTGVSEGIVGVVGNKGPDTSHPSCFPNLLYCTTAI